MKLKSMVEFLDKLVLEERKKPDMPGPELDIGTYIFSLQSFNNMIGFISLPPSYRWGTKPLEKEGEVTRQ